MHQVLLAGMQLLGMLPCLNSWTRKQCSSNSQLLEDYLCHSMLQILSIEERLHEPFIKESFWAKEPVSSASCQFNLTEDPLHRDYAS